MYKCASNLSRFVSVFCVRLFFLLQTLLLSSTDMQKSLIYAAWLKNPFPSVTSPVPFQTHGFWYLQEEPMALGVRAGLAVLVITAHLLLRIFLHKIV